MKEILKKKKIVASVVAAAIIIGATSTVAYFKTQTKAVENSFTTGSLKTEIEEEFEGQIQKNTTIKKTPHVVNKGAIRVFVRARVLVTPDIADYDDSEDTNKIRLLSGTWEGTTFNVATSSDNKYKSLLGKDKDVLYGEPDTDDEKIGWIYSDGYYYYNKPIVAGESTENIFSGVFVGNDVNVNFDVTVYQESVSASGYNVSKTYDVETIKSVFSDVDKK